MAGVTVNGNDVDEMYGAAKIAVDRARAGEGPTFIEANTFRFNGHLIGDAAGYIPKEELTAAKEKDPFATLRKRVIADGVASEADLDAIDAEIKARIEVAVQAAFNADLPDIAELKRDVFAHELA
jgi:pyruvate dehydrogenase E1 component alpha subunit